MDTKAVSPEHMYVIYLIGRTGVGKDKSNDN
jgi:hypothetical protein